MQYKKFGYFVYDTSCKKNYDEPFVNYAKKTKIATMMPTGNIKYTIERKITPGVGSTPFMKDSLFHRETVYNTEYSNEINGNDYCFQKLFIKK